MEKITIIIIIIITTTIETVPPYLLTNTEDNIRFILLDFYCNHANNAIEASVSDAGDSVLLRFAVASSRQSPGPVFIQRTVWLYSPRGGSTPLGSNA